MSPKKIARIAFWSVFIPASIVAGVIFMRMGKKNQVERYIEQIAHPNAAVATEAWINLRELYMTSWEAYELILTEENVHDERPISFLIEQVEFPDPGKPAKLNFWPEGKPIFYKTDTIFCATVGESILAFVHNEQKSAATPYAGDWYAWWDANKGHYGR